jgi:hypothetical protein
MTDYLTARERPIGIAILSVLVLLGALLTTGGAVVGGYYLAISPDAATIESRLEAIGIPLPLLIANFAFIILLKFGSGVGLWTGSKWGWHLATLSYAYVIVRNLNAIFVTHQIVSEMSAYEISAMPHSPAFHYIKFGGRILVATLIYLYLFKSNVRDYFRMTSTSGWKVVVADVVICAAILATISIVAPELR